MNKENKPGDDWKEVAKENDGGKQFEFEGEKFYLQSTIELLKRPKRSPCKYCGETHYDHACNKQIEWIKDNLLKENSVTSDQLKDSDKTQ